MCNVLMLFRLSDCDVQVLALGVAITKLAHFVFFASLRRNLTMDVHVEDEQPLVSVCKCHRDETKDENTSMNVTLTQTDLFAL
jgi:hypothetical protein